MGGFVRVVPDDVSVRLRRQGAARCVDGAPRESQIRVADMKSYSELLRDPRWQRKRLEIMARDEFSCRYCQDGESTLNVHHLCYLKGADPWDYQDGELLTLCEQCHKNWHHDKKLIDEIIALWGEGPTELVVVCAATTAAYHDRWSGGPVGGSSAVIDIRSLDPILYDAIYSAMQRVFIKRLKNAKQNTQIRAA